MVTVWALSESGVSCLVEREELERALAEAMRHIERTGGGQVKLIGPKDRPIVAGEFWPVGHWRQRLAVRARQVESGQPVRWLSRVLDGTELVGAREDPDADDE